MSTAHERPPAEGVQAIVLGGSGYVAGELLRLLAGHSVLGRPEWNSVAAVSESHAGQPVAAAFPHLATAWPEVRFHAPAELAALVSARPRVAAFSAAPHGASARLVDGLLAAAEAAGSRASVVDLSADFRYSSARDFEEVYGHPHGAPHRLAEFACALPEHANGSRTDAGEASVGLSGARHVGHPGCFTTATLLAAVPLVKLGLVEPRLTVVATTGSTGSGRTPGAATHHPERHANLFAYKPLAHRHEPEMRALAGAAAERPVEICFVPQSGPFARGIYATLTARTARPLSTDEAVAALAGFYAGSPFVGVSAEPPRLAEVVGTNRCRIGVAVANDTLVAFSAIDNLVKGAAGGAVQWMNRLLGLPESTGLTQPGLGWV